MDFIPMSTVVDWMIAANRIGLNGQVLDKVMALRPESAADRDWLVCMMTKSVSGASDY